MGDSLNDLPMLSAVDHPIFLKGEENLSPEISRVKDLVLHEGTGPQTWNKVILSVLREWKA
jgi:phosphoserine phosphatase